jgi:hypothetical protein
MAEPRTVAGITGVIGRKGIGKSVSFKRPMQGRTKGGAKLRGQGIDPASGRKVFKQEFRSGFKMAKTAGMNKGKGAPQVQFMRQRLSALDAGKVEGKPGERSFLRGALHAVGGGSGGG